MSSGVGPVPCVKYERYRRPTGVTAACGARAIPSSIVYGTTSFDTRQSSTTCLRTFGRRANSLSQRRNKLSRSVSTRMCSTGSGRPGPATERGEHSGAWIVSRGSDAGSDGTSPKGSMAVRRAPGGNGSASQRFDARPTMGFGRTPFLVGRVDGGGKSNAP